jgi:sulfatase modifying factor 1
MLFFSRCVRLALGLVASVSIAVGAARAVPAATVNYQVVAVGNPGNAPDTNGRGGVSSSYNIGKYEVTIGQYVEFLNAVATTSGETIYDSNINTNGGVRGITRTGDGGGTPYSYAADISANAGGQSAANRPVTYVNWFNAARFANWMSNGQPSSGGQTASTTEDGAYNLSGAPTTTVALNSTNPNTGAAPLYALPTLDQWYKAAYYDPTLNGGSGGYYAYATQSNTAPGNSIGSAANQANHVVGGSYAVTGAAFASNQNYLTDIGAFSGSGSSYGTFDQGGNTGEWYDPGEGQSNSGILGGAWNLNNGGSSTFNVSTPIGTADYDTGFRLVSAVPEPGTIGMLASGLGFGLWHLLRRRRRALSRAL